MGYEPATPPVPTREQEKEILDKTMKSFLQQSSGRYYMNEALRLKKLEMGDQQREYYRSCTVNLITGILSPFLTPLGSFMGFVVGYLTMPSVRQLSTGVPYYKRTGINWKGPIQIKALD